MSGTKKESQMRTAQRLDLQEHISPLLKYNSVINQRWSIDKWTLAGSIVPGLAGCDDHGSQILNIDRHRPWETTNNNAHQSLSAAG
jgi:hypothetical protein